MTVRYKILQQVNLITGCRLEVVFDSEFERPARQEYARCVESHPTDYFELLKVTHAEDCLAFTPIEGMK